MTLVACYVTMSSEGTKQTRKTISESDKLKILNDRVKGKSVFEICQKTGLSQSTVSTIWQQREDIWRRNGQEVMMHNVPRLHKHNQVVDLMEPVLVAWIREKRANGIPFTAPEARKKGLAIYTLFGNKMLAASKIPELEKFTASTSWYQNFLKRHEKRFAEEYPRLPARYRVEIVNQDKEASTIQEDDNRENVRDLLAPNDVPAQDNMVPLSVEDADDVSAEDDTILPCVENVRDVPAENIPFGDEHVRDAEDNLLSVENVRNIPTEDNRADNVENTSPCVENVSTVSADDNIPLLSVVFDDKEDDVRDIPEEFDSLVNTYVSTL